MVKRQTFNRPVSDRPWHYLFSIQLFRFPNCFCLWPTLSVASQVLVKRPTREGLSFNCEVQLKAPICACELVTTNSNNVVLEECVRSLMKIKNSRGPRIEPCGTPCVIEE